MKLLITTGGGGHFSPALAVINAISKDWEVVIIGRKYALEGDKALSLEYQTAKRLDIPFYSLTTGRLQRKLTRRTLFSLAKIPVGWQQALQLLQQHKPDIVLSFGGYVTVPVVLAAAFLRIPVIVHEQVLGAGLANKIAGKFAQKICVSWKESAKFFPKEKVVLTGNPVRKEFIDVIQLSSRHHRSSATVKDPSTSLRFAQVDKNVPLIYVTGGSAGAHALNLLIEGCLERLLTSYNVIHQTGDSREFGDFDRLEKKQAELPQNIQKRYIVMKFIDPTNVAHYMSESDLIIARSGINTVTELLYVGKPCLLVPLPYGQHNEQLRNALFIKKRGLGEIADQLTTTPDTFYTQITQMLHNRKQYTQHASEARKLIDVHAVDNILKVIHDVQTKKKSTKT